MRFFSNENKDSNQDREPDEQDSTVQLRTPDPAAEGTQPVPLQRTGSPWSAAPGDNDYADDELAAQERADGSEERGYAGDHRTGGDAVDLPLDDRAGDRSEAPAGTAAVDSNRLDEGAPIAATSSTATYGPDGDVTSEPPADVAGGVATNADMADNEQIIERDQAGAPLRDDGGFDDPRAVDPATDQPLERSGQTLEGSGQTLEGSGQTLEGLDQRRDDSGDRAGSALRDDGGFDDPKAVDPATDRPLEGSSGSAESAGMGGTALRDDGGFDDPKAVDPATDRPLEGSGASGVAESRDSVPDDAELATDANTEADDEVAAADQTGTAPLAEAPATMDGATVDESSAPVTPVPMTTGAAGGTAAVSTPPTVSAAGSAAPPGEKMPGSVAAPDLSSIFDPDDATSFHERWRDVQLKFVDSPKDATTEAAGLLDEAVEKLAASLRTQKSKLHQVDSDDTETLRVELRGYRDILNRVLGL